MKFPLPNSVYYCVKENKPCARWAEKYFKDCVCNLRDKLSLGFGMTCIVCWGVAELAQIITNFRTKSAHGVSILLLLTWVAGDIFNLVGCLLEPATLPTQLYTAVLYTTNTVVLLLQALYYGYICKGRIGQEIVSCQEVEDMKKPLKQAKPTDSAFPNDSSSDDEANPMPAKEYHGSSKSIKRSAGYGAFLATFISNPHSTKAFMQVYVGLTGRKLLHQEDGTESAYGQWSGWMMAAVYMGSRLPQVWLNIERGTVEGLNPFLFVFALAANAAYVASILVRSTAWDKVKANMPWLVEGFGCLLLDIFITSQYVYYRHFSKGRCSGEEYGCYTEANEED